MRNGIYRTCPVCSRELPLTREYFKRLVTQGKEAFHNICKECEATIKRNVEWQDGKLLCHCCKEYKDISCFSPNGKANPIRNNRKSICHDCDAQSQRERNINLSAPLKLKKCINYRYLAARDRAIRHNLPFNITLDYLLKLWDDQNGRCAISGIEMTYELNKGRTHTNVSIDKIDRTKGYVIGNIQLVCMACNQIKSDMSEDKMYYFCKHVVENYENQHRSDKFKC